MFFSDLALLNAPQLSLASEASGRATQTATRDFATWVQREHQTFAEELTSLAKLLGDETAVAAFAQKHLLGLTSRIRRARDLQREQ